MPRPNRPADVRKLKDAATDKVDSRDAEEAQHEHQEADDEPQ